MRFLCLYGAAFLSASLVHAQDALYPQIAGTYEVYEESTVKVSGNPQPIRGSGTWRTEIVQIGNRFSFLEGSPGSSLKIKRRGTLTGNDILITGTTGIETLGVPGSENVTYRENVFRATGTVENGRIVLQGSGRVVIAGEGGVATITMSSTFTFTGAVAPADVARIRFSPSSPPSGTVSGAGVYRLGETATVRATWNRGSRFVSWDEYPFGAVSTDPEYSFTVERSRILHPHYNSVPPANYTGLLQSGVSPALGGVGSFRAALNGDGIFSLVLTVQNEVYRLKGGFDREWKFERMIPRPGRSDLRVALLLDPASRDITGAVSTADGAFAADLEAEAHSYARREEPPHTMLLPPPFGPASEAHPPGTGFLITTGRSLNSVRLVGRLADGTPVSLGTRRLNNGKIPIHVVLYRGTPAQRGNLFGTLPDGYPVSDGTMHWLKPERSADRFYPRGFAIASPARRAPYDYRSRSTLLVVPEPPDNARIELAGGGLPLPGTMEKRITLGLTGGIAVAGPNPEKVTVRWNRTSGVFAGSFIHPVSRQTTAFAGVLLQAFDVNQADGYFLGPVSGGAGQAGRVTISPRP